VSVVIPGLMAFCPLIPRPRVDRITDIALSIMQALTTIAGAIIEWKYHILGTCPTYEANRPEMSAPEAIVCATLPARCSGPDRISPAP
jgi:hypothetical protein